MGLKAAVQALKKAEPLKDKVQRCKDLLNDNDAWICQQQLQKIYQQVLILDLEYALDRKVEQELWNLGFKNYIATLQTQAKDRKNPKRGESQAMLGWCLEAASGFYLTLLQEICTAFDLDLPFRRKNYIYGCSTPWKAVEKLSAPHKSSCFYACQYCLVHLGDIARYRNQNKQAELFYRHAVSLSPSSGQPYNQLALLEASRGDKLGTVFHYARSVAVKHPFPVATANLAKTLSSALNDNSFSIEGKTKLSSQEYIAVFLKLHGILHNLGDLSVAGSHVKLLTETLTALVATESFSSWRLVQMLVINLYALHHTAGQSADCTELLKSEQLSSDENIARDCILDLIAGSLSALLLPVYTIKNAIIDYFALPTIKLCLEWMRLQPTVLEEPAFVSRLQIWPSLCVLLNGLQACVADFEHDQYTKVPLPEDRDLQGFLPLEKSFEALRFANADLEGNAAGLNKLRAVRILSVGHYLAQYQIGGTTFINVVVDEKNERKFACMAEGSGPSNELMKELEELSLNKERQPAVPNSPVPSESASSKASSETDIPDHSLEKRVGILKPQGSLERNRDSNSSGTDTSIMELNSLSSTRKPRQNVAMQAIMRRAETEQKQVTFKNVSPMIIEELDTSRNQATPVSPIKTVGTKNLQNHTQVPGQNGVNSQSPGNGQSRGPQNAPSSVQIPPPASVSAPVPPSSQVAPMKLQLNIPQTASTHQFLPAEQQTPSRSQFGIQPPSCAYPNQTFNVQNPQFSKNFVTSHASNVPPQYQMQGQFNGSGVTVPPCTGIQQNVYPPRTADYQRLPQTPMMQQTGIAGPPQSGVGGNLSQGLGLQQPPQTQHQQQNLQNLTNLSTPLQQSIDMHQQQQQQQQQQQHQQQQGNGIGMHRQNVMSNNIRTSRMNMQNQMNVAGPSMVNNVVRMPFVPNPLRDYLKNLQPNPGMQNVSNPPMSPTDLPNLPTNFNQNFGQNIYSQMNQKQMSPSAYGKNTNQFVFPNSAVMNKPQHSVNNYPMFHNYETTDFNLWKDTQPPQPPVAWWGSTGSAPPMQAKETSASDAFQSWANSPGAGNNMIGRTPLTPGNNYHQNPLVGKHYSARNSFDEARQFEMEQKQAQSTNTGNTYSLFSGNTWGSGAPIANLSNQDQPKARLSQQSLWSGPGPSPLERLLEQQKSLREGGT